MLLIVVCLSLGLLFQRLKRFNEQAPAALNAYVIHVALPALVLSEIPRLVLDAQAILPVAAAWLVMLFSALLIYGVARWQAWSPEVSGGLLLVVTLGNTSFLGLPLIQAHLGDTALPYAILYDNFGTFVALNTFGIWVAAHYSAKANTLSHLPRRVWWKAMLSFPPFLALLLAFALRSVDYPLWFETLLSRLSSTLVPVVMLAVGLQWQLRLEKHQLAPMGIGLLVMLVLAPAFAWLLMLLLGGRGIVLQTVVLEAAMPSMITAGALAIAHNLAPKLVASLVGYSLMLSLVTVWGWRLLVVAS